MRPRAISTGGTLRAIFWRQEKPNYVVMMLGVSDRQNIRERDLAKEADKTAKEEQDKKNADQNAQTKEQADDQDQPGLWRPSRSAAKTSTASSNFAATNGPRFMPSASTTRLRRSRARACRCSGSACRRSAARNPPPTRSYLNDLFRARAERAGVNYIDVWDGFVDEAGKYSNFGPDYEGQMRRLRSDDGVYFTKSGARKLAHYVEREIRRYMSNRVPVAFPAGPVGPVPARQNRRCARSPDRWCR